MAAIDRRTFLRGIAYAVLGRILGWELTEIAEAKEELGPIEDSWSSTDWIDVPNAAPEETSEGCYDNKGLGAECTDCPISDVHREMGEYTWVCNGDGTVWLTNGASQIWFRYDCYPMPAADATAFIPKDPELPWPDDGQ